MAMAQANRTFGQKIVWLTRRRQEEKAQSLLNKKLTQSDTAYGTVLLALV
jgi:hypothetical protein